MKTIAIIPARSGSKGLKDKNIKLLAGKPLMAYSIEAAVESNIFDTVMVSTDSKEYADIALEYGAEVPFLRGEKTSSDEATTKAAVLEVLEMYANEKKYFDSLMILQPTSPLRTARNIIEAVDLYIEKKAKGIISVCETDHSPLWQNTLPNDLNLSGFVKSNKRRQELDKYYRLNGAIYLYEYNFYINNEVLFCEDCYAYIMDKYASIDIDDKYDFDIAEMLMKK